MRRLAQAPNVACKISDKLFSYYDALLETFKMITSDFAPADKRKLFHDNAQRFYRL